MSDIQEFIFNGGHARLSIRKAAELMLVDKESIRNVLKRCGELNLDLDTEIITTQGFGGGELIEIIGYFAMDAKRITDEVRKHNQKIFKQMAVIGAQTFIDRMAGIQEPTPRQASQKFLLADWREKRESGKLVRHEFTDMVKEYTAQKHPERQYPLYAKYTDLIYSGLFGTTAKNLRQLPVVDGVKIIGRNHLPATVEIEGVAMAEDWTTRILEMAVRFHIPLAQISLVRAIALSCAITKTSLALPHLGKSESRGKVLIEMCQDYRNLTSTLD